MVITEKKQGSRSRFIFFQGHEREKKSFCRLSSILILSFTDMQCTRMCAFELQFCFQYQSFLPVFEDNEAFGDE